MTVYYSVAGSLSEHDAALLLLEKAWYAEQDGPLPRLAYSERGKPYFPEQPDLHFSLSHSGGQVACCLAETPCGCDLQEPRELSPALLRRCFHEDEQALGSPLHHWCLKECFVKLTGRMDRPYREMAFLPEGKLYRGPEEVWGRVWSLPGGFVLAVAARGEEALPLLPRYLPIPQKTG